MSDGRVGRLTNLDIDTIEDVATISCHGFKALWLEFAIAVASLSAFTVEYRLTGSGTWLPMASAGADYTTPVHPVLKASGNLVTAAAGQHFLKLDIAGVHEVRIRAAGTSSTLNGTWRLG